MRLKPTGAVSDATYDAARTAAVVAKAQLQVNAAKIEQMEAVLHQVEVDLANTDIRSPVNGVIIQRSVELGQTVAASLQSPTIFTIADDLRRMEIAVSIDETDVGRVKPGQRVVFSVSAYPGREFEGKVKHVRLGSQTVSNVVTYTGIVSIENPKMELLPGMTASVKIETNREPTRLLRQTQHSDGNPGSNVKGPGVWVLGPDGGPRMVQVRLGLGDGSVTEISTTERCPRGHHRQEAVIKTENLDPAFQLGEQVTAWSGVTVSIAAGEYVAVTGPSGPANRPSWE